MSSIKPEKKSSRTCRNLITYGYCRYESKGCMFNHDQPESQPVPYLSPHFQQHPQTTQASVPVSNIHPYDSTQNNESLNAMQQSGNSNDSQTFLQYDQTAYATQFDKQVDFPHKLSYYAMRSDMPELQYHLCTLPPSFNGREPNQRTIQDFFMHDRLREELLRRNEAMVSLPSDVNYKLADMPTEIHTYHSLIPMENVSPLSAMQNVFGYRCQVYRAVNSVDGFQYILYRLDNCRLPNESAISIIEPWQRLRCSAVVSLKEAFTTKQFGDNSIVFVYEYHACSTTLASKHFAGDVKTPLTERQIWSYISQICLALSNIHQYGIACRVLSAHNILVTGKNRIRINYMGILDVLAFGSSDPVYRYEQEDLLAFGHLILVLSCGSLTAMQNFEDALSHVSKNYSANLKNLMLFLLSPANPTKTMDVICGMTSTQMMHELNGALRYQDTLEMELLKEIENGRHVRLLTKLGFINERPEFDMDKSWSETGDRYLLKLFRDYVFHSVDEYGNPIVDLAHVIACMNKLDAGSTEKIVLTSRDSASCLIVSYADLKRCVQGAFDELCRRRK